MGDDLITFAAVSDDPGGEYAFWLDYPPAGAGPPKHVHAREEEGFREGFFLELGAPGDRPAGEPRTGHRQRPAPADGGLIANHNESSLAVCNLARGEVLRTVQAGVGIEARRS